VLGAIGAPRVDRAQGPRRLARFRSRSPTPPFWMSDTELPVPPHRVDTLDEGRIGRRDPVEAPFFCAADAIAPILAPHVAHDLWPADACC